VDVNLNEIVDVSKIARLGQSKHSGEIIPLASKANLKPAIDDKVKRLLLVIDQQNDFMPGIGSLGVPGADQDVKRLINFLYRNAEHITSVMCSMDTHFPLQIFHPAMWENDQGQKPDPFTVITYDDVSKGLWKTIHCPPSKVLKCLESLKNSDKVGVTIWPYHCLVGTSGFCLEAEFANLMLFHSYARSYRPLIIFKGTDTYSEMYGIIEPEYNPQNFVNTPIINAIEYYDEIYIAGQAASHCVLESAKQILKYYEDMPSVTTKFIFLGDCSSPVAGFEKTTKDAFKVLEKDYGVKISKSTDICF